MTSCTWLIRNSAICNRLLQSHNSLGTWLCHLGVLHCPAFEQTLCSDETQQAVSVWYITAQPWRLQSRTRMFMFNRFIKSTSTSHVANQNKPSSTNSLLFEPCRGLLYWRTRLTFFKWIWLSHMHVRVHVVLLSCKYIYVYIYIYIYIYICMYVCVCVCECLFVCGSGRGKKSLFQSGCNPFSAGG